MGFISVDARGEERKEGVKKRRGDCEIGRSGNGETGRARRREDLKVIESLACFHTCARWRGINLLYLFQIFFLYTSVFLSVITPCHLPGDSSETLSGRAPLGFIEYLPRCSASVQNDTRTKE